jgi:ketosteroid isomerase-like protein
MDDNAEMLRRGYAAFAEGDLEAAMGFLADDIQWQGPRSNGLPDSGDFHGKDEVRWMFKHLVQTYGEDLRVVPDEFVREDQTIVVLGHMEASPRGTALKVPWVHVWKFQDGSAARVLTLTDTALVRDALATES